MTVITGKKVFAVITGASRGIGRQIALSLAADVAGNSSNFVSMVMLNNQLYEIFTEANDDVPLFVINITSLCSVMPMPSMTQYCVGKATREAYFRNFAIEVPNVRILNYSPGPVETDMLQQVHDNTYDLEMKKKFAPEAGPSAENRKRLTPMDTVSKLIGIIDRNDFENGSRIDYFDS